MKETHARLRQTNPKSTLKDAMLEAKKTRSPVEISHASSVQVPDMPKHYEHVKGVLEAYKNPFVVRFD